MNPILSIKGREHGPTPRPRRASVLVALLACLALPSSACEGEAAAGKPAKAKAKTKTKTKAKAKAKAKTKTKTTIAGTVTLKGAPPKRTPLARDTDPVCAQVPRLSEDIVTGPDSRLRDVHVRIAVGTAGTHAPPDEPARVTQHECMYTPRVVGVMAGQDVAIVNGDPTYHNVRGAQGDRTLWNLGQPPQAPAILRQDLGAAGQVVSLHCDVHQWMRAYAVITDHPYFDVTGDDGAFTIEALPPGPYLLEAWHPTLGLQSREVQVEPGAKLDLEFQFSAPR